MLVLQVPRQLLFTTSNFFYIATHKSFVLFYMEILVWLEKWFQIFLDAMKRMINMRNVKENDVVGDNFSFSFFKYLMSVDFFRPVSFLGRYE